MWLWQHADQAELAELEDARSRRSGRKLGDAMGWGRLGWFKGSWAVGKVRAGTRELDRAGAGQLGRRAGLWAGCGASSPFAVAKHAAARFESTDSSDLSAEALKDRFPGLLPRSAFEQTADASNLRALFWKTANADDPTFRDVRKPVDPPVISPPAHIPVYLLLSTRPPHPRADGNLTASIYIQMTP